MTNYLRRQRWDRFGASFSRLIAMLVLLIVILLMGYLLMAVLPIGWPDKPQQYNSYPAEQGGNALLAFSPDQMRTTQVLSDGRILRFSPQTGLLHSQFQLSDWFGTTSTSGFQVRQLVDQQREYLLVVTVEGHTRLLMWDADALTDQHLWPAAFRLSAESEIQLLNADIHDNQLWLSVQYQRDSQFHIDSYVAVADEDTSSAAQQEVSTFAEWVLDYRLLDLARMSTGHVLGVTAEGVLVSFGVPAADLNAATEPAPVEMSSFSGTVDRILPLQQNMLLVSSTVGALHQLAELDAENGSRFRLAVSYRCGDSELPTVVVDRDGNWFACVDDEARASLFYVGREAPLWRSKRSLPVQDIALAGTQLLVDDGSSLQYLRHESEQVLDGRLLWQPVWYPGYSTDRFVWQPTASDSGSAKFSITPLLFGTLKAAILALLFGVPIAVLGAIYAALILPRKWRERLKPVVEMLEAMPTVIIGFLAAVWLAPYLQDHLLMFVLLLLGLPLMLVLLGYFWSSFLRRHVPHGMRSWVPVVLITVLMVLMAVIGWLLEWWLFDGQLSAWLEQQWGWTYDLRNSLVVGIALGLAITPTIFALCEDALASVPRHLRLGAMALGASRWQAVWQVIVPCAASGLLAAVLIGLGRALGETMIVLMAASNTPLIEASPLRGLQAIAPALAIEMPEADPGGLHFRVLMLCALVLFVFTLLANTLAELIRERLRRRYQI